MIFTHKLLAARAHILLTVVTLDDLGEKVVTRRIDNARAVSGRTVEGSRVSHDKVVILQHQVLQIHLLVTFKYIINKLFLLI